MKKTIRFALLGCGRISKKHAESISRHLDGAELTAVCDLVKEKAESVGNAYSVPYYTSYEEMLEKAER